MRFCTAYEGERTHVPMSNVLSIASFSVSKCLQLSAGAEGLHRPVATGGPADDSYRDDLDWRETHRECLSVFKPCRGGCGRSRVVGNLSRPFPGPVRGSAGPAFRLSAPRVEP